MPAKPSRDLKNGPIAVSDHALLRYAERFMGLDRYAIIEKLSTPGLARVVDKLGDGQYPLGNGLRVQVKGRTIVTVIPED